MDVIMYFISFSYYIKFHVYWVKVGSMKCCVYESQNTSGIILWKICFKRFAWLFAWFLFLDFDLYEYHMDLCDQLCSPSWLAIQLLILCSITFHQTCFIPALFTGTMTCTILYHFQWPLPWLGVGRSAQSKASWLYFLAHFSTDQHEIWYGVETFQVEYLILLLSEI